eukprot:TRINITY_DN643_c0_g1_i15.p1 TRINITY_DN643_c0_g1~~TRINITY_DN643_c0_g1_i15.p1  ORF type:complete len:335 (-),score=79.68 TRINITY_DN643_c0_g1_i15:8-955(-)
MSLQTLLRRFFVYGAVPYFLMLLASAGMKRFFPPVPPELVALHASKNLVGKTAVVVGGTNGIGKGIALRLAKANVSVTIVGRSAARGEEVVKAMSAVSAPGVEHSFMACDAMLLRSVAEVSVEYARTRGRLDYLVLTQGMATIQGRTETSEGLDQKLSLHYYSRMAFIQSLLPLLKASEDPRVLSVLSAGVHSEYTGYQSDPELQSSYSLVNAAHAAGMYNDLAVDAWSRAEPTISFTHAAPGGVNTAWGTEMPWYLRAPIRLLQPFLRSIDDCGEFMVSALFDDQYRGGFHLMDSNGRPVSPAKFHKDEARESM